MNRPANIGFLTPVENECLELLLQAQDLFDDICAASPQSPTDSYNFGHYLDAARSAVIMRGARRLDPENLLVKKNIHSPTQVTLPGQNMDDLRIMKTDKPMPTRVEPGLLESPHDYAPAVHTQETGSPRTYKPIWEFPKVDLTADLRKSIMETIPEKVDEILTYLRKEGAV